MNILITGGCGFVGVNLVAYLSQKTSHRIIALDNLKLGRKEHLAGYDVEFIEGDIRDESLVGEVMKRVDAVIHLAADTQVIPSIANPTYNYDVNVNGTYNLLRNARDNGVHRFVFASTGGAIIGDVAPPVNESMVPRPLSPYGASKLCGEAYCSAFAGSYGMQTVALRFSNVYGPRSFHKGSVVAQFFKQILRGESLTVYGDGEQTRDYVFVEDLCEAIINALAVDQGGKSYQLGTGIETSLNTLIRLIRDCVGETHPFSVNYVEPRQGEVKRNFCDISLARAELGYNPAVSIEEGLARTWEWFRLLNNGL